MNDPAVLFYTSDFLTGVLDMSMEERGQYITLLCYQHQKGHIKEETIRLLVGYCSVNVLNHFKRDENGLYYNERMDIEIEKRLNFTESRRKNGKKGGRPKKASGKPSGNLVDNHMANLMGNENEDINKEYIINYYINNINTNISSIEYNKLEEYINIFSNDLRIIVYGIEYCKMYKAYSINYLCKILNSWVKANYKTLEEIKTNEKNITEKRESKKPVEVFDTDWLND